MSPARYHFSTPHLVRVYIFLFFCFYSEGIGVLGLEPRIAGSKPAALPTWLYPSYGNFFETKNSVLDILEIFVRIARDRNILTLPLFNSLYYTMWSTINQDFIDMIEPLLPDASQKDEFVVACTRPLKKSISINIDKISVEDFIELVTPRWWTLTPNKFYEQPTTFYIDREDTSIALGNTFLYKSGFFYIQEVAASMPAPLIDIKPWDLVLDVCAAPWGKTSQLANRLLSYKDNPGLVIANDVAWPRIQTLAHNLNLQWCYNTWLTKFNGFMFGKHLPNFFDHVLVDAPCSGEWTGFKSDHALKFWRKEEINKIAWTQFQILVSAIKATKVWGTIVYSTCTLNPYENEQILARVIEFFQWSIELETIEKLQNTEDGINGTYDEWTFEDGEKVKRYRPHIQKTGGFFVSKIRKVANHGEVIKPKVHKLLPKNQFKLVMNKRFQKDVAEYTEKHFWIKIDPERHFFIASKDKVYCVPPMFVKIQPHIHCEKVWVPVFKTDRLHGFRPSHCFGLIFGHLATKNVLTMTSEEIQNYTFWKDMEIETPLETVGNPYRILQRSNGKNTRWMWVTKWVEGRWKNKYGK